MHHRLAHVLRAGSVPVIAPGQAHRCTVVGHDLGVVHGDDVGLTVEVVGGVAAGAHDLLHQPVGVAERAGGVVDETRLHLAPGRVVLLAFDGIEAAQPELLPVLLAVGQVSPRRRGGSH